MSGRASHSNPNLGNVPSRSDLGHQCRGLFGGGPDRVNVGADASGLQLRLLGHYLARWDAGAFARQCEDGDIHEYMRQGTGLHTRDKQKTWTYAMLFGAAPALLGRTVIADHVAAGLPAPKQSRARTLGKQSLDNLGDAIPAFPKIQAALEASAERGYLETLDGRKIPVASQHLALAMLLQGAEAIIMKKAIDIAAPQLLRLDARLWGWVHDELQVDCDPHQAPFVGEILSLAIVQAGEYYNLRVRLDADYQVGESWRDTH